MNSPKDHWGIWFDPRTKMLLMLLCTLAVAMAPSLVYEMGLVLLIAVFALLCRKVRIAIFGSIVYALFYLLTIIALSFTNESTQVILIAFLGLIHKIYPCGFIGGIIIGTTRISEFLSAMNKLHAPKSFTIPLAIMLRYIPTIQEDWHFIKDAMRLRDVSPTLGGFLARPVMTLECIYAPLLMAASKTADELTIASVTRGIESPIPRTCFVEIDFRAFDFIILACFIFYFVAGRFL